MIYVEINKIIKMLYKDFFNTNAKELHKMWLKYIPDKEGTIVKTYKYYQVYDSVKEKKYTLLDDGSKIIGFKEFMYFTYEHSI